jgi:hypothetical protein
VGGAKVLRSPIGIKLKGFEPERLFLLAKTEGFGNFAKK